MGERLLEARPEVGCDWRQLLGRVAADLRKADARNLLRTRLLLPSLLSGQGKELLPLAAACTAWEPCRAGSWLNLQPSANTQKPLRTQCLHAGAGASEGCAGAHSAEGVLNGSPAEPNSRHRDDHHAAYRKID